MGMTYWLAVRNEETIESKENDLFAIYRSNDKLNNICKELGVIQIDDYVDVGDSVLDFKDYTESMKKKFKTMDPDEIDEMMYQMYEEGKRPFFLDKLHWCSSSDGLATFSALNQYATDNPSVFEAQDMENLKKEFTEVITFLKNAVEKQLPFHLSIVQ